MIVFLLQNKKPNRLRVLTALLSISYTPWPAKPFNENFGIVLNRAHWLHPDDCTDTKANGATHKRDASTSGPAGSGQAGGSSSGATAGNPGSTGNMGSTNSADGGATTTASAN